MQKTIPELWKQNFKNSKNDDFLWDNILWKQSKRDFILKAYFIAGRIKKIKWEYVGIMLPAVGGASLLIMATYLAGKIPVMFNWTLPADAFKHCVNFSKVEKIISVWSFFDRIETDILKEYKNDKKFIFLEDLLKDWKITEKIGAFIKSIFMPLPAATSLPLGETEWGQIAVILFTSWSESLPKAVPLTHQNLIENISWAIEIFKIQKDDVLLGFLPPFHSFGFTVLTVLPLITAVKVAYTPNPTNLREVVEALKHNKANNIMVTPTLLKMLMARAEKEDFSTVELVISGAESLHIDILNNYNEITDNKSLIVEGYGITECSPIVCLNPSDKQKLNSVGKFIKGIDYHIMDLDSEKPLGVNEEGMIIVRGESVFSGYMDKNIESPFIDIEGKSYYRTGDLGYIDEDGYVFITGRLKRFIKIGGEMISMPFIEKVLEEKYGEEGRHVLAVEGSDRGKDPVVTLFSLNELDLKEVNKHLRDSGVASIAKIRDIKIVDEIPMLGSGKTNYRALKEIIEKEFDK